MEKRTLDEIEKEILQTKEELKDVHGTETEVYARIVGYYRAVKNWNKGKKDEFNNRKLFKIDTKEESIEKQKIETTNEENNTNENSSTEGFFELFTRKTCPNCPPVKEYMQNIQIEGKYIDVDTEEGLSNAASKGVFASPTVIIYNKDKKEIARGHSVEELSVFFDKIMVKETY